MRAPGVVHRVRAMCTHLHVRATRDLVYDDLSVTKGTPGVLLGTSHGGGLVFVRWPGHESPRWTAGLNVEALS